MAKSKKKKNNAGVVVQNKTAKMQRMRQTGIVVADMNKAHDIGMMKATAIILWMMRREYGFGRQRLLRMVETIHQYCLAYIVPAREEGKSAALPISDMCKDLEEECNIYINLQNGRIYGSKEAMEVDAQ